MRRPWGSTQWGSQGFSKSLGLLEKSLGGKGDSLGFGKRRRGNLKGRDSEPSPPET